MIGKDLVAFLLIFKTHFAQNVFSFETERESEIEFLYFSSNNNTIGNHPKKQLTCIGNQDLCKKYNLNRVKCEKIEFDTEDLWNCFSELPSSVKIANQNVSCESPKNKTFDDEIIKGGCNLVYSLAVKNSRSKGNGSQFLKITWAEPGNIRLRDIYQLNLYAGLKTKYRRKSPVDQLQCVEESINYCRMQKIIHVGCKNLGYNPKAGIGRVAWKCQTSQMPAGLRFGKLDIQCEKAGFWDDEVVEGLRYSLEDDSVSSGWVVLIIIIAIIIFVVVITCCVRVCNSGCPTGTMYTDHAPIVQTTVRPATNIYSIPVQPAVPVYYPPPSYTNTTVAFSGTSFRNDDSYVATGYAGTSFRGDDNCNFDTNTDTGYAGTSFR